MSCEEPEQVTVHIVLQKFHKIQSSNHHHQTQRTIIFSSTMTASIVEALRKETPLLNLSMQFPNKSPSAYFG